MAEVNGVAVDSPTPGPSRKREGGVRFAGYAALFDVRDRGGDVVRRGAFADARAPVPLLWQHDPARVIGTVEMLAEDAKGLRVVGRVSDTGGTAESVAAMLREGAVSGLSFGYRVTASGAGAVSPAGRPVRELTGLELIEVSVVTHPMQPGARVVAMA